MGRKSVSKSPETSHTEKAFSQERDNLCYCLFGPGSRNGPMPKILSYRALFNKLETRSQSTVKLT